MTYGGIVGAVTFTVALTVALGWGISLGPLCRDDPHADRRCHPGQKAPQRVAQRDYLISDP